MNIGQRIKERRKSMGLTVDEVAKKLNKNRATVYRYESNDIENLPISILEPLAEILQTTPSYLMGWEDAELDSTQNKDFYNVLLKIMKNRNLSIPDIARATGLSDSTLRSIISRKTKNISLEVAFKLSQGLNVSLEELNGDKEITSNSLEKYSEEEQQHIDDLRKLNVEGKNKVITYTKDLMDNPKFINEPIQKQSEDEISATSIDDFEPYLFAAHNDGIDEETNIANIEKIKKKYLDIRGK